jgi:hypothetical protein
VLPTGRYEEAAGAYQQAVEQQRIPFDKAPQVRQFRQFLNNHYRYLARVQRQLGRLAAAAAASVERAKLYPDNPQQVYAVACELALCLPLVGKGKAELTKEEQAERQKYADQVMAMLRQAVAAGFDDAGRLKTDKALAPLRTRDDFKQLLAEIEQRRKKPGP